MKFSEAKQGRIFVVRLEDGEIIHEEIEKFAVDQGIRAATLIALGGADLDSRLIVGPETGRSSPVVPMEHVLDNVHEICGTGTIFPDDTGTPVLHMHIACGRGNSSITGCVRRGVRTWHIIEIVLLELLDCKSARLPDTKTGFKLLVP